MRRQAGREVERGLHFQLAQETFVSATFRTAVQTMAGMRNPLLKTWRERYGRPFVRVIGTGLAYETRLLAVALAALARARARKDQDVVFREERR